MRWKAILAVLAGLSASIALADDFKTIDGKEYKNVKVSRVEPDGLVLMTKSGISKVYFTELPKEVQERFGYDPQKAAEFTSQAVEQNKLFLQQRAADEQKRAEERAKYLRENPTPRPALAEQSSASAEAATGIRGSIPMLPLQQLEADQFSMVGRVVGVQFGFRSTLTRQVDANWFSGEIERYDPSAIGGNHWADAYVLIPSNALSWFQALPSGSAAARDTVVYAQVEQDQRGGTVLRLLGIQIRRDTNGTRVITW